MSIHGEEKGLIPSNPNQLDKPREKTVPEIQREILEETLRILKDPRCVTLSYSAVTPGEVALSHAEPDYEHGGLIRFVMLKVPQRLGRDELCLAVVHNPSRGHNITLGDTFFQAVRNELSTTEIGITRFTQSPKDRITNEGIFYRIVLSDNIKASTGTFSLKAKAHAQERFPNGTVTSFRERWDKGNIQMNGAHSYYGYGDVLDFQEADYRSLLSAIQKGKIDVGLTQKVVKGEQEYSLAKPTDRPMTEISAPNPPKALP